MIGIPSRQINKPTTCHTQVVGLFIVVFYPKTGGFYSSAFAAFSGVFSSKGLRRRRVPPRRRRRGLSSATAASSDAVGASFGCAGGVGSAAGRCSWQGGAGGFSVLSACAGLFGGLHPPQCPPLQGWFRLPSRPTRSVQHSPQENTLGPSDEFSSFTLHVPASICVDTTVPCPSGVSTRLSTLGVTFCISR